MKMAKKLWALLLVVVMMAGMVVPAFAGTYEKLEGKDTGLNNDGKVILKESMTLEKDDTPNPAVKYTFAVTSTAPVVNATFGTTGGASGAPTITSGKDFASYDSSTTYTKEPGAAADDTYVRKSAETNIEFDFSGVDYTLPGVYYWEVTKTASGYDSNEEAVSNHNLLTTNWTTATSQTFYIYATVTNKENDGSVTTTGDQLLQVTYGFCEKKSPTDDAMGTVDKDNNIVDQYPASPRSLTVKKIVNGNQGDRTKAFPFTIALTSSTAGSYDLEYTKQSDADSFQTGNPDKITLAASGTSGATGTVTVYLKHDQQVTVTELPEGVGYTVTENSVHEYKVDGYNVSATVTGDTMTKDRTADEESITLTGDGKMSDTALNKNGAIVTYTNDRTTTPPTGVLLAAGPALSAIAIASAGIAVVTAGKRRREDEE